MVWQVVVGAIVGGLGSYLASRGSKEPSIHSGRMRRAVASFAGSPSVREQVGPVSESRAFAGASDTINASRREAERRALEAAARHRLGPSWAAGAKLATDVGTSEKLGAARGVAATRRAEAGTKLAGELTQAELDIQAAEAAQRRRAAAVRAAKRQSVISGTLAGANLGLNMQYVSQLGAQPQAAGATGAPQPVSTSQPATAQTFQNAPGEQVLGEEWMRWLEMNRNSRKPLF